MYTFSLFGAAVAFGMFDLILFGSLFLCLTIGTSMDRTYHRNSPKWVVFGIGLVLIGFFTWSDWTFAGIWAAVFTSAFWMPIVKYLVIGLIYSLIEFGWIVRKSVKSFKSTWADLLSRRTSAFLQADTIPTSLALEQDLNPNRVGTMVSTNLTVGEVFKLLQNDDGNFKNLRDEAYNCTMKFIANNNSRWNIVNLELNDEERLKPIPKPTINRGELAACISAWTFMWPAYLMSLLFGNFLLYVFETVADVFVWITARMVRLSFYNVFKV